MVTDKERYKRMCADMHALVAKHYTGDGSQHTPAELALVVLRFVHLFNDGWEGTEKASSEEYKDAFAVICVVAIMQMYDVDMITVGEAYSDAVTAIGDAAVKLGIGE